MASRLPSLLSRTVLTSFAGRRARRRLGPVTALELDGATLRVVGAASRLAVSHVAAAKLDLPPDADRADPEDMGRAIAAALQRLGLQPGTVVMGVPRASVLLRTLTLPALDDLGELAAMVHLQISKDLPFRSDEAVIDFQVREPLAPAVVAPNAKSGPGATPAEPSAPAPKREVLVAVVKRSVVDFYSRAAAAAGLKLAALGLLPHATARGLRACGVTEGARAVAVVTLRPDEVGIDVVAGETLLFSRGASLQRPAGIPEAASDEAASPTERGGPAPDTPSPDQSAALIEAATIEVVRSLHSYGGMAAQEPVTKLVVAGATGHEATVVEALQARLSIPCAVLDVGRALDLPASAREPAAGALSAIGLALGADDEEGLPFDFLNPRRPAVARDTRRTLAFLGTAAVAAVVLFVLGLRSHLINQRDKLKAAVAAELAEAKKKRPLYRQMKQQLATIEEWSRGGQPWLDHYAYLTAVLPPSEEVYVTSFSVSGSGVIRLQVLARSGAVLAKLDRDLRAAGYDVKPLAITPGEEKHGYNFRSTVELTVPEKMKFDLAKVKPPPRPADDASLSGPKKGAAP